MTSRLNEQLEALRNCGSAQLREQWRTVFRTAAPDMPTEMMRRALSWRLQERTHGGLSPVVLKSIAGLQSKLAKGIGLTTAPALKSGTRLIREWHGRIYIVLVCDTGFEFEQRHYRSLSQIAREITGAAWSGPRFFGLNSRAGQQDGA